MVGGAVGAGDAGAVEDEGDAGLVQGAVHEELVERAVEEGGVDRDDRVQPGERQAGRRGERVLLGDADVEDALGVALGESLSPTGISIAAVIATMSGRSSPMRPSPR